MPNDGTDMARGPGRPREFDPDKVLDAIIDVFWELGYERSDMEALSNRAGVTKPSLYNTFGTKEDLFVAAINRYRETRSKLSFDALIKASTPREGIHQYFLNLAQNVAGDGHPSGCLIMSVAMPLCDRLPKVAAALDGVPQKSNERLMSYFSGQIAQGNLPQSFDSAAAVGLILDLTAAMTVQARFGAPLMALNQKAARNTQLVLFTGAGG